MFSPNCVEVKIRKRWKLGLLRQGSIKVRAGFSNRTQGCGKICRNIKQEIRFASQNDGSRNDGEEGKAGGSVHTTRFNVYDGIDGNVYKISGSVNLNSGISITPWLSK